MRVISYRRDPNGVIHGQAVYGGGIFNFTANPARDNLSWTVPDTGTQPPVLYRKNGSEFDWAVSETGDDGKVTVRVEKIEPDTYWLLEDPTPHGLKIWEITVPPFGEIKYRELVYGEYGDLPGAVARRLHLPD